MFVFYATYIVPASALIPIFIGLNNYRFLPAAFKILLAFVIFGSLFNLLMIIIASKGYYTVKLMSFYTAMEFAFIAAMFSRIFDKKWRVSIYILVAVFAALCTFNQVFIQNKIEFNTYTRPIGALIIVAFCMAYTIKNSSNLRPWAADSFNWVNTGILIFYAVGFFMFVSYNFFLKRTLFSDIIWGLIDTILIIEYILFAIGFSKCRSQTTTIPQS
ncbi:hypothetical protein D0C36_21125 [Mucilaginibacter conchicola]|uniref:Uncharacterized protein n=1 Tax=Mucilaginibacter conchicola TaxID=2303333 RepID=A0A372NPX8_9SPHI|nr:hypothetical protein [Mucilaginibacter conchicola]RFZ90303.1 hypothetical protein D0C36_21125 [Mucilaginibacter conchicola]